MLLHRFPGTPTVRGEEEGAGGTAFVSLNSVTGFMMQSTWKRQFSLWNSSFTCQLASFPRLHRARPYSDSQFGSSR